MQKIFVPPEEGMEAFIERLRQEKNMHSRHKDWAENYADYLREFIWIDLNRK
ncbi:hypothetical protein [Thermoanaerobacterium sp. DL9XJH110]|uniref:hypothetical protein n=1 Tax=Thermoanaerobacterium sp. DL9XJH110 TaxID=3386643 RepID=UPI003BB76F39